MRHPGVPGDAVGLIGGVGTEEGGVLAAAGELTGEEGKAAGRAGGGDAVGALELDPVARDGIEVGSGDAAPVALKIIALQFVGDDPDDVGAGVTPRLSLKEGACGGEQRRGGKRAARLEESPA